MNIFLDLFSMGRKGGRGGQKKAGMKEKKGKEGRRRRDEQ